MFQDLQFDKHMFHLLYVKISLSFTMKSNPKIYARFLAYHKIKFKNIVIH
jgi:hypothetical protein